MLNALSASVLMPIMALSATKVWAVLPPTPSYVPWHIPYLTTHQPNGNPDGQVNYYHISFNVTSANGGKRQQAYCWDLWGDNGLYCNGPCEPYSTNVPTGQWIPCAVNENDLGDTSSGFFFQLYPYFSIGNFSLAIKQNFTDGASQTIAESDPYLITNSSAATLVCNINPEEVDYEQHAQGDCVTPTGSPGFDIPVARAENACTPGPNVQLRFLVQERTVRGDNVFVFGNITQLGNWSPYNALPLNSSEYDDINTFWEGGLVLPAGTAFEFKYMEWAEDGLLLIECGENRVYNTPVSACTEVTVGNVPDYYRCGDH